MSEITNTISDQIRQTILRRNIDMSSTDVNELVSTQDQPYFNTQINSSVYTFDSEVEYYDGNQPNIPQNTPQRPYLTPSGELNYGNSKLVDGVNIAGSLLSGQGVGIDGGTILPNYDVRNTIIGKGLSAMGLIDDSPIGMIGNRELMDAFKNRVLYNTQRELLGKIDLDPISVLKGNDIIRPNYDITVGYNTFTKVVDFLGDYTGFEPPISLFSRESSVFYRENDISSLQRALNQIKNTGKGQVQALFRNLKENKFVPRYEDGRNDDGIIAPYDYDYEYVTQGFKGLSDIQGETTYDEMEGFSSYSMLGKTKLLFEDGTIKPLNTKGSLSTKSSEINQYVELGSAQYESKGSGVLSREAVLLSEADPDKVFARVFSKDNKYDNVNNLQKKRGLDYKNSSEFSVLDSNGFVRISPNVEDDQSDDINSTNIKKFMFSLENLAWSDSNDYNRLPHSERGPGDPVNGTKGRIMWFPPYGLNISENSSVDWGTTTFIGRGEPIYTYNNTERIGNISFKMIMDYPSYMDDLKGVSKELLNSIISGEIKLEDLANLSPTETSEMEYKMASNNNAISDTPQEEPEEFSLYFEDKNSNYVGEYSGNSQLNDEFFEKLSNKLIKECPSCTIIVRGTSSYGGETEVNKTLSIDRANEGIRVLRDKLSSDIENKIILSKEPMGIVGCKTGDEESECKKKARRAVISFEYDPTNNITNIENEKKYETRGFNGDKKMLSKSITKRFLNEATYFRTLSKDNPIAYESIKEKLDFFHPSFHSITPEGFNSRLNFLLQCTRQGPTQNEDKANNLAFGRAPICILRIGDFYHTKIAIDNVNFNYDMVQWDLNPEGIGVQPMICNVDMSFKMIGGSSLRGPINKLQNAVSFNFFSNTEVYDPRADKIVNGEKGNKKYSSGKINLDNGEDINENLKDETPIINEKMRSESNIPQNTDLGLAKSASLIDVNWVDVFLDFKIVNNSDNTPWEQPVNGRVYWVLNDEGSTVQNIGLVSLESNGNNQIEIMYDQDVNEDNLDLSSVFIKLNNGEKITVKT